MIWCLELVLLNYLENALAREPDLKDANKGILLLGELWLLRLLAEVQKVYELVWELLKVNHDLLLILQDVVVLLWTVHLVNEVRVIGVSKFYCQHLGLLRRLVGSVDYHFYIQVGQEVLAVVGLYADQNWRFVEGLVELKLILILALINRFLNFLGK